MRKKVLTITALFATAMQTIAGGFITSTNQSISFLRMPAQEAVCSVDGAYFNPAGIGFISDGFHIGFNWQTAKQTRQTTTTFAPLAYGDNNNGSSSKEYEGTTQTFFLPSLDLAYKQDKWFVSTHFGVTGGGGKATYDDGLGSFESQIAVLPAVIQTMTGLSTTYGADIFLEGSSYYAAGQLNAGYRLLDNLSLSAGVRVTYVLSGYDAYIKNITLNGNPAAAVLTSAGFASYAPLVADKNLDAKQTGLGVAPIISIDYKLNKLNLSARYEFREKVTLTNETTTNTTGMAQYDDAVESRADIPALLAVGAGYSIIPSLRLSVAFHEYFDKNAKTYNSATGLNDKQDYLDGNCWEILAGAEYDINKMFTVSAGVQCTQFNYGDKMQYISDMSYNPNSTSVGIGGKINASEKVGINVAFFKTLYSHMTKNNDSYYNNSSLGLTLAGSEEFYRTSWVFGAGIDIAL